MGLIGFWHGFAAGIIAIILPSAVVLAVSMRGALHSEPAPTSEDHPG